jgi:fructuronate reductase
MMSPISEKPARLSESTVTSVRSLPVPTYDRTGPATIAHLGMGAFARAHLGVYADDLLRIGRPALIRAVSLHSHRAEEQLAPQDGLYTVTEREPGSEPQLRVIGSIASVATGTQAALEAVTAPEIRLVTLTITEKGYDVDPDDAARPHQSRSVPGVLALALAHWQASGRTPPIIASLDNLSDNGSLLRARVTEIAGHIDPLLPEWITKHVSFPNSVVDRMVPATTEQDLYDVSTRLGLVDLGAVMTEQHRSWVMTSDEGLNPLGEVGVQLVDDIGPFEQRKLWLLNGPHSALAYCGLLVGCATIAAAATHTTVSTFVRKLIDDVLQVAQLPAEVEPTTFALVALRRFENPSLSHTCAQVAADGSRKLPQRFGPIITIRGDAGLDNQRFATVVALWIAAAGGIDIPGIALPLIDDPEATRIRAAGARDPRQVAHVAVEGRFDPRFAADVERALSRLLEVGASIFEVRP